MYIMQVRVDDMELYNRKQNIEIDRDRAWVMDCCESEDRSKVLPVPRGGPGAEGVAAPRWRQQKTYYISALWVHRFKTFADPGPITNQDFLCSHQG